MDQATSGLRAVARQELHCLQLMGVDFIPVGRASPDAVPDSPRSCPALTSDAATVAIAAIDKRRLLEELRLRHDATCPVCRAMPGITQTVFGEGAPEARLMFVGEAPGEDEDRSGRPFVGRAGQKLNEIIRAMGLQREGVYIANVLKSRPPQNRTPLPDEVQGCSPYLREQIAIISPAVIVALGGPAMKFLLDTETGITRMRGRWGEYLNLKVATPVMPTFHPAYLLRNYTRETREQVWSDMQAVLARLADIEGSRSS
jgi:DNA polymerase